MSKNPIKFEVKGVEEAIRRAKATRDDLIRELGGTTERAALGVANEAASNAPRLHGFLRNSITSSPEKKDDLTWEVGSDLPYAQRQEYEHPSRKGFFRQALAKESPLFKKAIETVLKRVGKR